MTAARRRGAEPATWMRRLAREQSCMTGPTASRMTDLDTRIAGAGE